MTRVRLHNEDWGFDSNCFVCEPRNDRGLRIPFFHDVENEAVVAEFALSESFSGAPSFVHGGVTLAVMDEAQAWAAIAVAGKFAMTVETTTRFERPIRVDRTYAVEAKVSAQTDETIRTVARVVDGKGRVCAETQARFAVLGPAQAERAIGVGREHLDERYLRND